MLPYYKASSSAFEDIALYTTTIRNDNNNSHKLTGFCCFFGPGLAETDKKD